MRKGPRNETHSNDETDAEQDVTGGQAPATSPRSGSRGGGGAQPSGLTSAFLNQDGFPERRGPERQSRNCAPRSTRRWGPNTGVGPRPLRGRPSHPQRRQTQNAARRSQQHRKPGEDNAGGPKQENEFQPRNFRAPHYPSPKVYRKQVVFRHGVSEMLCFTYSLNKSLEAMLYRNGKGD